MKNYSLEREEISKDARVSLIANLKEGVKERGSRFIVFVPTYNEIENIAELVEKLANDVVAPVEICIIDDNSPDGTAAAVEALKGDIKNLHLMNRPGKMGLGAAYLAGFDVGIAAGFEYIITMDADLSHEPGVINRMAEEIKSLDVVIGSRFVRGGGIVDIDIWRIVVSKIGNFITYNLLGMPFNDCTSGFRCYRTEVMKKYDFTKIIKARKYVFLVELIYFLYYSEYRIKEVPIIFLNRLKGKTKVDFWEMAHAARIISTLLIKTLKKKIFSERPSY